MVSIAQWVEQQGSEALGRGSNSSIYPDNFNFINTILNFRGLFLFYSYQN